jgi:hypothetical protein
MKALFCEGVTERPISDGPRSSPSEGDASDKGLFRHLSRKGRSWLLCPISTPHASTTSSMPAPIMPAASVVACWNRAALAVDGRRGDLEGESLREPRRARDVEGLLPHLRHAAADDLPDLPWVDAGTLDGGALDDAEKIGGMQAREAALAAADRAANGGQNDDFLHASSYTTKPWQSQTSHVLLDLTGGRIRWVGMLLGLPLDRPRQP